MLRCIMAESPMAWSSTIVFPGAKRVSQTTIFPILEPKALNPKPYTLAQPSKPFTLDPKQQNTRHSSSEGLVSNFEVFDEHPFSRIVQSTQNQIAKT